MLLDFQCNNEDCGHVFEELIRSQEDFENVRCPFCHTECTQLWSPSTAKAQWKCDCPTSSGGK